jgi:hypothetical protein
MFALQKIVEYIFHEESVLFTGFFEAFVLGVLLNSPEHPEEDVRLFDFFDDGIGGSYLHEGTQGRFSGMHNLLEANGIFDSQGTSGQGYKEIPCPDFEPGVTGQEVSIRFIGAEVELLGGIFEVIVKTVAWCAFGDFFFVVFLNLEDIYRCVSCTEKDRIALTDFYFEIAGDVEVFMVDVSAFLFFGIFDAHVPVWEMDKGCRGVELHVEGRIAGVEAGFNSVGDLFTGLVYVVVFVSELAGATEGQEGAETKGGSGVCFQEGVFDEDAVFEGAEDFFFGEDDTAHPVEATRDDIK